ncbi:hypothetical protein BIW11_04935 [Tropilaelaps mercedesae]|uniref:Uncharacterized protein n=1 Tax=Tropilaelaps mercedesae TaxID=418985 RepID=A0A1V9WZV1_9ACAR|nr:hypothetical protein BIW11_04935 [Tropilaelaps mercedesae]
MRVRLLPLWAMRSISGLQAPSGVAVHIESRHGALRAKRNFVAAWMLLEYLGCFRHLLWTVRRTQEHTYKISDLHLLPTDIVAYLILVEFALLKMQPQPDDHLVAL